MLVTRVRLPACAPLMCLPARSATPCFDSRLLTGQVARQQPKHANSPQRLTFDSCDLASGELIPGVFFFRGCTRRCRSNYSGSNPFAVVHCRSVTPRDCIFANASSRPLSQSTNQTINQSIVGLFSLVGRAPAQEAGGRGFESHRRLIHVGGP